MNKKDQLELYHQMVLIRRVEERGAELYQQGKIGGFMHLYIGQEAVSTGLIAARRPNDRVITAYRDHGGGLHLALTQGQWSARDEVLVRVHEPFSALDLLDNELHTHSWPLPKALATLQSAQRGAALLLNCGEAATSLLTKFQTDTAESAPKQNTPDLRTYGVGAQILRDLGITKMKLLGSPRRMPSMIGYGLEVTGFQVADDPS